MFWGTETCPIVAAGGKVSNALGGEISIEKITEKRI